MKRRTFLLSLLLLCTPINVLAGISGRGRYGKYEGKGANLLDDHNEQKEDEENTENKDDEEEEENRRDRYDDDRGKDDDE